MGSRYDSPSKVHLFTGPGKGWELHDGAMRSVAAIALSPDGTRLALGEAAGRIQMVDARDGRSLGELVPLHATMLINTPCAVAFSPVGRAVAGASPGGRVRVMDPDTGRVIAAFEGHAGDVTALAFAPDGRKLASASADGTVLIWSLPAP